MTSGVILVTIGLFSGWSASGKPYLVLGTTCILPAGAFLLQDSGSALGMPALILSALWIVGILVATVTCACEECSGMRDSDLFGRSNH